MIILGSIFSIFLTAQNLVLVDGLKEHQPEDFKLELLAPDEFFIGSKDRIVWWNENAIQFPKRNESNEYVFANRTEWITPPSFDPMDFEQVGAQLDVNGAMVVVRLSDVQGVNFAPYRLPAGAFEVEKVEESCIRSDDKSGAQEISKTVIRFKLNAFYDSLTIYSRNPVRIKDLEEALPGNFSWMKMNDLSVTLPVDPTPEEKAFTENHENIFTSPFSSWSENDSSLSLQKYFDEPQWRTKKGFDGWGRYYEGAETTFSDGTKFRVEIRRSPWPSEYYCPPRRR